MFALLRFVCELVFGSSLSLSRECFEYLSSNLHAIVTEIIQQSFSITLRSKRTLLLGDDLQTILKCRAISPLYGYCCSSTTDRPPLFESISQFGRLLFVRVDAPIHLNEYRLDNTNNSFRTKNVSCGKVYKINIVSSNNILLHVEWLAIGGEQKYPQVKLSLVKRSILDSEQQLYLSYLQSKNFNDEIWNFLRSDQIALNTVLANLIEDCRNNICECLVHNCQLKKRCQLSYYLTIIDSLLQNPLANIHNYIHILSPTILTCLLYEFEVDEPLDYNDEDDVKSTINTGHIWLLRSIAARACVKMLQRSNFFVYDVFYTRIISRLIYSLTSPSTANSVIYAILYIFEQLGYYVSSTFLLPHLLDIDPSKILSSKSIMKMLERISSMLTEK